MMSSRRIPSNGIEFIKPYGQKPEFQRALRDASSQLAEELDISEPVAKGLLMSRLTEDRVAQKNMQGAIRLFRDYASADRWQ